MRDVFYYGKKPNVHPRERFAENLEDARNQSTTDHFWIVNEYCDYKNFDWDFDIDEYDESELWAFDHDNVWPSQHQKDGGTWLCPKEKGQYTVYRNDVEPVRRLNEKSEYWVILENIDETKFDFSWHPDPTSPPYIYAWGNQYNIPEDKISVKYIVPGATDYKYMSEKVIKKSSMDNWYIPVNVNVENFDFSWEPKAGTPPYIYQFHSEFDKDDGPVYNCPNNDGYVIYRLRNDIKTQVNKYVIETTLDDLVTQHKDEVFWALRKNIDYTNFNFDWRPQKIDMRYESDYVHVFGSTESEITQTYFVNARQYLKGKTAYKFVADIDINSMEYKNLFVKPQIFYIDKGNIESETRYEILKARFNDRISKTRYVNNTVDTVYRCIKKSKTELFFVLDSEVDYADFDFDYYPNPWQMSMVHVFGTQHNHWGTTYLVNRDTFSDDTKYVKIIEHLNNINLVKNNRGKITSCLYDVLLIDHGNDEYSKVLDIIANKVKGRIITTVKYDDSYLKTLNNYLETVMDKPDHYLYVCSSICDYSDFDFTYVTDPFARDQLHVFPSNNLNYGDTFLIDVNKCKSMLKYLDRLENYDKINFNSNTRSTRLKEPTIVVDEDTHVHALHDIKNFPYARLVTSDNIDIEVNDDQQVNLWSDETKDIIIQSTGATSILVPEIAKNIVENELYDYPYIKKVNILSRSKPLDIVFLSNGETGAIANYEHLLRVTDKLENRVVHVSGINGRVAAYHAAARASNTPWFFTIFAKLEVNEEFDWDWQPDRLQEPKHYVFNALNPVNKLIYGHQAMIAYNKKLTLNNKGEGLDFTLDDKAESIPLMSGIARYNTDEFLTWKTAFREVLKLYRREDDDSKYYLDSWLNKAEGDFAMYSLRGAADAVEYYESVEGDFDKLKLSYEWDWLRKKFDNM